MADGGAPAASRGQSLAGSVSARRLERAKARQGVQKLDELGARQEMDSLSPAVKAGMRAMAHAPAVALNDPLASLTVAATIYEAAASSPAAEAILEAAMVEPTAQARLEWAEPSPDEAAPVEELLQVVNDVDDADAAAQPTPNKTASAAVEEFKRTRDMLEKLLDMQRKDNVQRTEGREGMPRPEQLRLEEKIRATMTRLATLSAAVPMDYFAADSLFSVLARGDVKLLSAKWLVRYLQQSHGDASETGANVGQPTLPRRQECSVEAFLGVETLILMHDDAPDDDRSGPKPYDQPSKRAPIIAVSTGAARPTSEVLVALRSCLEEYLPTYAAHGYADMGVYIEWASSLQPPFDKEEEAACAARARDIRHIWYAHSLVTIYLARIPGSPQTGWGLCEAQLACLAKPRNLNNVWPQVVTVFAADEGEDDDRPADAAVRLCPLHPGALAPGGAQAAQLAYADDGERALVAQAFEEAMSVLLAGVAELDYSNLMWGDAEVQQLGEVLPLCTSCTALTLEDTQMRTLPETIGEMHRLELLILGDNEALCAVPEAVCSLPRLRELQLNDCPALSSLPDGLGKLGYLEKLHLGGCSALKSVPECINVLRLVVPSCQVILPMPLQRLEEQERQKRLQEAALHADGEQEDDDLVEDESSSDCT